MSDADPIARKLDFMRADIEEPGGSPAAHLIAGHAALLLGALEAVRALHQPLDRGAGAQCKGCATHVTFTRWPCPTYEAITRELTGEGR